MTLFVAECSRRSEAPETDERSLAPWVSHGNHIASRDNKAVTIRTMSIRTHILLLVLAPLVLVALLVVFAQRIPVPELGRGYVLRVELPEVDAPSALPEIAGREGLSLVVIDPGHGGEDPGALGPGRLREKDVVLAIARELHDHFEREPGFSPTLVRSGDYYVSLRGRRDLARKRQADLFVSIHADAFTRKEANGASVYALSTRGATSTTARYLAEKENAADLIGGVRLADKDEMLAEVLADLSMTSTLDASLNMGASVLGEMDSVARLHKRQVEQAAFAVLKSPDIPSILVETGFISNPSEARKLATASYRRQMAAAIFRGLRRWWRDHPPPGTLLAWQKENGVGRQYTIARGDTLSGIAQRFNVSVADLKSYNGLRGDRIMVGKTLKIPAS